MAEPSASQADNVYVPRVVSFLVLLTIILLLGIVFFRVMAQFIVPLFLACVLLVVFQPLHRWYQRKLPKWPRIAALLTTITILITVLVPTIYLGWNAYVECADHIEAISDRASQKKAAQALANPSAVQTTTKEEQPSGDAKQTTSSTTDEDASALYTRFIAEISQWVSDKIGITIDAR